MRRTKWTKEQNRRLKELYHAGCSDEQIISKLGEEGVRTDLTLSAICAQRRCLKLLRKGKKKVKPRNVPPQQNPRSLPAGFKPLPPTAVSKTDGTVELVTDVPVSTNGRVPVSIGKAHFTTDLNTAKAMLELLAGV